MVNNFNEFNNQILPSEKEVWTILGTICDPEIPVLTIIDLGIVSSVKVDDKDVIVNIIPTYTACPAMDAIALQIRLQLLPLGFNKVQVNQLMHPSWSSDNITEEGKQKLKEYGIAPPKRNGSLIVENGIECPQCKSLDTIILSEFGSTACKALFKCNDCLEPFDYFKCY